MKGESHTMMCQYLMPLHCTPQNAFTGELYVFYHDKPCQLFSTLQFAKHCSLALSYFFLTISLTGMLRQLLLSSFIDKEMKT